MKKHLSIIGFRVGALKKYISAVPGELEEIEKIELFRMIENNVVIGTFKMDGQSLSIDTEEDYQKACRMIETDSYFLSLFNEGFFDAKN
jgi:3-deoxy-manno-octulosonate cytidylyltransferase (CMP-KDO synthetase)